MTGLPPGIRIAKCISDAMPLPTAGFRADSAARDAILDRFQDMVDCGFASWWLNEEGGTELHLSSGEAFLLEEHGILCLRAQSRGR